MPAEMFGPTPTRRRSRRRGPPGRSRSCRRPQHPGAPIDTRGSGRRGRPVLVGGNARTHATTTDGHTAIHFAATNCAGPSAQQNPDSHRPASAGRRQSRPLQSEPHATSRPDTLSTQNLHDRQRHRCVSAFWAATVANQALFSSSETGTRLLRFSALKPNSHARYRRGKLRCHRNAGDRKRRVRCPRLQCLAA